MIKFIYVAFINNIIAIAIATSVLTITVLISRLAIRTKGCGCGCSRCNGCSTVRTQLRCRCVDVMQTNG